MTFLTPFEKQIGRKRFIVDRIEEYARAINRETKSARMSGYDAVERLNVVLFYRNARVVHFYVKHWVYVDGERRPGPYQSAAASGATVWPGAADDLSRYWGQRSLADRHKYIPASLTKEEIERVRRMRQ